jgi:hypothetical protein
MQRAAMPKHHSQPLHRSLHSRKMGPSQGVDIRTASGCNAARPSAIAASGPDLVYRSACSWDGVNGRDL